MIGTPRAKTEVELHWSAIKRAITARVNYEAQVWRERELNARLTAAFSEFDDRLKSGELPVVDEELSALGPGGAA
jgi:hypothetical protein